MQVHAIFCYKPLQMLHHLSSCLDVMIGRSTDQLDGYDGCKAQDMFGHDKGQKSAISGKFLHWIF